jgi:predicted AlkP superfamily pyrophosphatase or phosphodiesterase
VLKRREQHGWFVNRIAEDAAEPGSAYSFGHCEEIRHSEIIIFGGPVETMHRLMNDVGQRVKSGHKYSAGDRDSNDAVWTVDGRLNYRCPSDLLPPHA